MRIFLSCVLFVLIFSGGANGQFLKTRGTAIVNERGDTVLLRGMGLGGWMLQEGYMFRLSNLGQQYRIREKILDVVGPEKTKEFYEKWLTNHTTRADIDSLRSWGFNSIRLPMHYDLYTLSVDDEPVKGQHTWLKKGFDLTDSLLNWCKANKMYLILDLHAAPGGQGNDLPISDRNPAKLSLWESEENKQKTIALWRKLAEHYANEPWIGGYDIINEPNWGFEDPKDTRGISENKNIPLRALMVDITKAIREVDKKHIVIIEGNGFGNNYRGVLPPWDENTVISFHKYGNFNTTGAIKGFLDIRDTHNVPIWLGESGENSNTWFTEAIMLCETNGIGWAWWQHKKMGINNPLEIKRPEGYDQLLSYWSGKGEKPGAAQSWSVLMQLLENLKTANNIYHPDVVDAMIRQVQTTSTIPFRNYSIGKDPVTVKAVDFDIGRQRYAYYDTDTARYQYTPGVNTDGNRGHMYRNDGVDIQRGIEGHYVADMQDSEWMKYTVKIMESGKYKVSFISSAPKPGGSVNLEYNGKAIIKEMPLPETGDKDTWKQSAVKTISLSKGIHVFRVEATKGGFNLAGIQFEKIK
ncbi:MAG: cellulase family glycosylhydrolase [Chitinophagaceae bacterium]|nr:cellulase family glycosylhydrolase [Chitinophagaceae bacterium]